MDLKVIKESRGVMLSRLALEQQIDWLINELEQTEKKLVAELLQRKISDTPMYKVYTSYDHERKKHIELYSTENVKLCDCNGSMHEQGIGCW